MNRNLELAEIDARVIALHEVLTSLMQTVVVGHPELIPVLLQALESSAKTAPPRAAQHVTEIRLWMMQADAAMKGAQP